MAPGRSGLRTCSVPDVLRHYRAVIFEDLQAAVRQAGPGAEWPGPGSPHLPFIHKNLTGAAGPGWRGLRGAVCSAQKEHGILLAIASLGRTLRRAVARGRRGALEKTAWTVAMRTEAVMRRHCGTLSQVRGPTAGSLRFHGRPPPPPHRASRGAVTAPLSLRCPRRGHRLGAPGARREPGGGGGGGDGGDRGRSLTVPSPTAEPAAQDAPSPESPRPEAAPRARPGRRRHLLGETLRAAGGGPRGSLARVLRGPRSSRRGRGAAGPGLGLRLRPSAVPPSGGPRAGSRPLPRRGPRSSEGPSPGDDAPGRQAGTQ
ncbi:uncharacterized protein C20orf204 homolog isoform X2 [Mustela erminea]|nr:uncharacterized protein C20orf204 homolog isoform X2 [Mustela erminea]XP_032209472.1 uncharacterized protein C20orf204 homolog isoform X2 [Mustela erminea]